MKRKILYVTGTRADYGLMRELLLTLNNEPSIAVSLCVTGMHLSSRYGNTIDEIIADGMKLCATIPVDVENTTPVSMAKSIGHEILAMVEVFEREQPDIVLLLGDRGEQLAAAISASHLNLVIVHLHGGERSGTVDEMVRHAISKFAHFHFVATAGARERLIKMGERDDRIYVTGAPGLDEINSHMPCTRLSLCNELGLDIDKPIALLVFHPVVQEYNAIQEQIKNAFDAALSLSYQIICLEPNSDAGGNSIREVIGHYAQRPDVKTFNHLARKKYLDCLANVDVLLGNSSSGIIEAASFDLMVVNIGSRQNLREHGDNVINTSTTLDSIIKGLNVALQATKQKMNNIYGDGATSARCCNLLQTLSLTDDVLNKSNVY